MKTRAITGFFFVLIMVGALLLKEWVFLTFFTLLALFAQREFYLLVFKIRDKTQNVLLMLYGAFLCTTFALYFISFIDAKYLLPVLGLSLFLYFYQLYNKQAQDPFRSISMGFLGVLYVLIPFIAYMGLGFVKGYFAYQIPLGFLILLWSNDTGAYLSGRSFGKRKLFERISPNKTWEGFLGGLILAVGVSLSLQQYFGYLTKGQWICIALIISIFGTLGDLVESMLKRSLDVKDSGNILPGHGGLLDRFDGLLLSAPIVYIYITLIL